MKNLKRKGFTIVELVIVIAVVAILAAVLIPTFSSIIKKANLSADQQAIRNMNTAAALGGVNGKYENPSDVLDELYANGFNLGKMETYSADFSYAYNYEENKFYLLDDKDAVIYPSEVNKDKLWGFYYNSVSDKLEGVNSYIAMENITNVTNFKQSFETGTYNIDLNGYFIDLKEDSTSYDVTVFNGAYISGVVNKEASAKEYQALPNNSLENLNASGPVTPIIYENKVITSYNGGTSSGKKLNAGISFKDCVFYNSSFLIYASVSFENCTFIGGPNNACIYIDNDSQSNATIDIKNCIFDSTVQRPINIASSAKDTINIIGCEFNGTSNVEKHIIQIASKTAVVTIQDCDFNALGTSPNIIRFNDGLFKQGEVFVEMSDETIETLKSNFKFINNRIASDISVDKYVDTDDSDTKEASKNSAIKLDEEITKIMK